MSKSRAAAVALAVFIALGAGVATRLYFRGRGPRCDRAAYERVHRGMTVAEASAAIGGPPGDYTGGAWDFEAEVDSRGRWSRADHVEKWVGSRGLIVVFFDEQGRAGHKGFLPH
jgi:hypothetical protein